MKQRAGEARRRVLGAYVWLIPVGLLVAVALAVLAFNSAPSQYVASRQVLFLSKPTARPDVRAPVNPFLDIGPSLFTAADVISLTVTDERTVERIAPPESGIEYTATMLPGGSTPVLAIEAIAPDAETADTVADEVVSTVAANLQRQQAAARAPADTWIVSSLIASSGTPSRDLGRNIVWGLAAFVAAAAATLIGAAALVRLRRRRGSAAPEADEA